MKKILLISTLMLVFMLGCASGNKKSLAGVTIDTNNPELALPVFDLVDFEGQKTESIKIFDNGKPTLFVFMAEWCPHCQEEAPYIEEFYEKHGKDVNVVVVHVNSNTTKEKSEEYIKNNGYTYPSYFDEKNVITNAFGVKSIPTNFKVENNKIKGRIELPADTAKFEAEFGR